MGEIGHPSGTGHVAPRDFEVGVRGDDGERERAEEGFSSGTLSCLFGALYSKNRHGVFSLCQGMVPFQRKVAWAWLLVSVRGQFLASCEKHNLAVGREEICSITAPEEETNWSQKRTPTLSHKKPFAAEHQTEAPDASRSGGEKYTELTVTRRLQTVSEIFSDTRVQYRWKVSHVRSKIWQLSPPDSSPRAAGVGLRSVFALDQEAKDRPNIHLQEKIHRGILWGVRNISDTL